MRKYSQHYKDEKITLMLMSNRKTHVHKLHFPAHFARPLLFAGSGLVILFVVLSIHYFYLLKKLGNYDVLQEQNQKLTQQLGSLENKVSTVDSLVQQVYELSTKLSIMAGVKTSEKLQLSLGARPDTFENTYVGEFEPSPEWDKQSYFDEMNAKIDIHKESLELERLSLEEVYNILQDQSSLMASTPSINPTDGWVTSGFGMRVSPWTGKKQMHAGIDIAARAGTEVMAPADGVVVFAGMKAGFGKTVVVNHGYDTVTLYAHLSQFFIEEGKKVKRGDVIGAVGSTGRATGPHVHYEVLKSGEHINPANYILD